MTELILTVFRLNGLLLAAGDRLGKEAGLSSARWQVLGALHIAGRPATIGHIAQSMGLSRQAVQRLVQELAKQGYVSRLPNPRHKRANFIDVTKEGRRAYRRAMEKQRPWAEELGAEHDKADLKRTIHHLKKMIGHLERDKK